MGYTKNTVSGFSWQTLLRISAMAITLGKIMVIARILSPNDFGIFSLIAIALGLAESSTQTGINITIIQSKRTIEYFLDTAWVIAITRGILIGILMVLLGIFMSNFYDEQSLTVLIAVTALVPIIKGFINPSIVLYHKNLQFFKDSMYRFSLLLVEALFAIIFSLLFRNVSALIGAMLATALFEVMISFWLFKQRPSFNFIPSRAKVIFSNSYQLSISSILSYLNENIDDFIFARVAGTYSLGLYHNAYNLGHKANYEFAKSINHSILPVFTKISDDVSRLKNAFLKSLSATVVLTTVLSLPLFFFPELVVQIILGEQWLAIVPVLWLFVAAGILQSISIIVYSLFYAKKEYTPMNLHLFVSVILLVVLLLTLGKTNGIVGAGQALLLSRILTLPLLIYAAVKVLKK